MKNWIISLLFLPCAIKGQTNATSPAGRVEFLPPEAAALMRYVDYPVSRARYSDSTAHGADRPSGAASYAVVPHGQLFTAQPTCREYRQRLVAEHRVADHPADQRTRRSG